MSTKLYRYTGEWPPLEAVRQYPNWEYALNEEHVSGQDETTLRPAADQSLLGPNVAFTAGHVTLNDGRQIPALIELDESGIGGLTVYGGADWGWTIRKLGKPSKWHAISFDWLPQEQRPPQVEVSAFPIAVETVLPSSKQAEPIKLQVSGVVFP